MSKNNQTVNILFVGDIVGNPGLNIALELIPKYKEEYNIHFSIVNIENAKDGKGGSSEAVEKFKNIGVDVFTGGNHTWDNFAFHEVLKTRHDTLRPFNYPPGVYGKGYGIYDLPDGMGKIGIINLQGRVFMNETDCPFRASERILKNMKDLKYIFVDFHAESTAEKMILGLRLDGKVSVILGTHTHVQTADAQILPQGTGFCTDVGMTGPSESVIGMAVKPALQRMYYQTPQRYQCAEGSARFSGAIVRLDKLTGKTKFIKTISFPEFDNIVEDK